MVSLDDVATRAGVSKSTASRVLNNRGYLSQKTIMKVQKAVQELNYQPNELARNLKKKRSGTIGLLVPDIEYPFYSKLISHIESELYNRDIKLMLCNSSRNNSKELQRLQAFQRNKVDGLILCDYGLEPSSYQGLNFPVVCIDRYVQKGMSYVASDHRMGGTLAANCLIENGCREVIHIAYETKVEAPWAERHIAFSKILKERGVICHTVEMDTYRSYENFEKNCNSLADLLKKYPYTDGFFGSDLWAVVAVKTALKLGYKIPKDFKIIGYDGTILSEITTPSITTICQSIDKIAFWAVDTICKLLEDDPVQSCEVRMRVELMKRETTY